MNPGRTPVPRLFKAFIPMDMLLQSADNLSFFILTARPVHMG